MKRYVLSWHEYIPEMQPRRWWLRWLGPKIVQRWRRYVVEFETESMPIVVSVRFPSSRLRPWQLEEISYPTPYIGPTPEFEIGGPSWTEVNNEDKLQ